MKVTKIILKNYLNYRKDLVIDLTYPSTHPLKAGKPLDKVCLIGQSGTGKSTILNLIKFFSYEDQINPDCLDQNLLFEENVGIHFLVENTYKFSKWSKGVPEDKISSQKDIELIYKGENGLSDLECKAYLIEHFFKVKGVSLLSFPFDTIRNFNNDLAENYQSVLKKPEDDAKAASERKSESEKRTDYLEKKIWDFSIDKVQFVWNILIDEIKAYEPDYIRKVNEFLAKSKANPSKAQDYIEELVSWEKEHENPLKQIVQKCIDSILCKFNLKVNTEIDFEKEDHLKLGRIQRINDLVEVPTAFLSTGTLQILATSIPLSVLTFRDATILFDEPERSLYPDTQIGLIKEYTTLVPNAQFFFATHSPIVASAFEPCERIIFDFDEDGKVITEKGVSPEGDDPNDILYKDFGMDNILEEKGLEAYKRFIELKSLMLNETNLTRKQELMSEYLSLNIHYRFDSQHETNS